MRRRPAWLVRRLSARTGCEEWEALLDGEACRAIAYAALCGPLQPGDAVLLNTTAQELSLGTGGAHFVIARLAPEERHGAPFAGRDAGHIIKLRYTPLQMRVLSGEEEASPHREAVVGFTGLNGTPVLCAELLSQAAAAAIAGHAVAPEQRIALVFLDTAALPIAHSRLIARLREGGVLAGSVTTGQSFGGDVEAVNVYTGLILARAALHADWILVTQGPGNVGTGTPYGFGGLALSEALHACDTLGGRGLLAARMSDADPRARHQGLSHHTRAILQVTRAPVTVPLPEGIPGEAPVRDEQWPREWPMVDPRPGMAALDLYREHLTTMGRGLNADPLFFRAAAAAGIYTAGRVPAEPDT